MHAAVTSRLDRIQRYSIIGCHKLLLPELNSYLFQCKIELSQFLVNLII